ncbi:MAG: two-component response regulator [Rickettsiaceae bacterium]|jgi:two-component system chemotaxis response regulator CheY|nr:two-component response regulator [Rickettsiaceae bacterium]
MKNALIVDDSPVIRKAIKQMLEKFSITCREAENGQVALEECAKQLPNFIILDWNMPVMTGIEFLKAFKQNGANPGVVVIVCTTENELDKIQAALQSGASEYIMKPFDEMILKDKLIQTGIITG